MNSIEISLNHIRVDHSFWDEEFDNYLCTQLENMIEELDKLEFTWCFDEFTFPLEFKVTKCNSNDQFNHDDFVLHITADVDILKYSDTFKKCYKDSNYKNVGLKYFLYIFSKNLEKRVYDTILTINIAYPGCFEISNGTISIDNKIYTNIPVLHNRLLFAYENIYEKRWPEIEMVSILDTWLWLETKTDYLEFIGKNAIDRSINAFSYSFNSNNYEDLFYSLLGIEALYNTEKSSGIMEQIKDKTALIFGEPQNFKKVINTMYANRSAFLHGKMNFPSKYFTHDADEDFEKFVNKDYVETILTAQGILISTFRKLIKNKANKIKTTTTVTFE